LGVAACRTCGKANAENARFCHACGSALGGDGASVTQREVRKTVTVLFADVAGSTAIGERLDPETLRSVMSQYFEEMRAVLERHGGTVEKFIGDAVMAVFGVPVAHEDDALRAVRSAAEMQSRIEELNEELEDRYSVRLEQRIGVNTGEVVAGDPAAGQAIVTGDAVNLAKRLEQAAPAGGVLIGKATYPLVKDAVKAGPLESFSVRGKAEPVSPFRLDEIDSLAAGVARRFDRPLVGREAELSALEQAFEQAAAGGCRLVTILGPPGMGKTRLAAEFGREIGERATVLTGRCLPYGEGITFWPLREIVRELGGKPGIEEALQGTDDRDLVMNGVLAAVGESEGAIATAGAETAWAFRRLFDALAQARPLVLVFEDVHWAAPTLLDLIEYLHGWGRAPILIVCLARPELVEQRAMWVSPRPDADSFGLQALTESESEAMLQGLGDGDAVAAAVRREVAEVAGGNPLFLEQMAAMLADEKGGAKLEVPPSIQALLAERLDQLSPDERGAIERAAVIGREFWGRAVADLSPPDGRDAIPSHLMSLVRRELIRPDLSGGGGEDSFRFQHILIRDAAYDALPKRVRAELHERFARWLEENSGQARLELEEIAGYHFEQAFRYHAELGRRDTDVAELGLRAAQHLGRAGERALAGGDVAAAANLLERASEAVDESDPGRPHLLGSFGVARLGAGELESAEEVLTEAIGEAERVGDVRTRHRAAVELARLQFLTGRLRPDEARAAAEQAIAGLEPLADDLGLAKAWLLLVLVHNWLLEYSALDRAADRVRIHAGRAGAPADAADALLWAGIAIVLGPRPVPDAIKHMEEIGAAASGPLSEAASQLILGCLRVMTGDNEVGRECYRRSEEIYRELGMRLIAAAQGTMTGWAEYVAGDSATAEKLLRAGYDELDEMGERGFLSGTAAELATVLCSQGRYDEAEQLAAISDELSGPADVSNAIMIAAVRARVLAARGQADEAEREARSAVQQATAGDAVEMTANAYCALAEVMEEADREREAAEALQEALRLYEGKGNVVAAKRVQQLLVGLPA
jgi:class 3 adenylate cyclase/tetratricopeptide (TPR) repeat protein